MPFRERAVTATNNQIIHGVASPGWRVIMRTSLRIRSNKLRKAKWLETLDSSSFTHSSRGLNDCWGIKDNRATTFLHPSLSSAFRRASPNPNPVHLDKYYLPISFSVCLSSSLLLPALCDICASPVDLIMCPYHLNLRFLTVVIISSYGPIACLIVFLTSSFVTWSL